MATSQPIIASYVSTTNAGANWYSVKISDLSSDLMEYFQDRADRSPDYTIISDEDVMWCTQFLCEDRYAISTGISKNGNVYLDTKPVLSAADRRAAMLARTAAKPTSVSKAAVDSIDVEL
jgi:hypothetical protein